MDKRAVFFIFVSILAGLNLGSIRKAEDPIRDTQTNPILYEQKKEEEKDGKKGPLMYSVKYNPRENFFNDPPFEKEKKSSSEKSVTAEAPSSGGVADWWEEQSTEPQAVPPAETVVESLPESLPEPETAQEDEVVEPSAASPEAGNPASGQGDDQWW